MVTKVEVNQRPHNLHLPIPKTKVSDVRLLIGQDCPQVLAPLSTVVGTEGEQFAVRTFWAGLSKDALLEKEMCRSQQYVAHKLCPLLVM